MHWPIPKQNANCLFLIAKPAGSKWFMGLNQPKQQKTIASLASPALTSDMRLDAGCDGLGYLGGILNLMCPIYVKCNDMWHAHAPRDHLALALFRRPKLGDCPTSTSAAVYGVCTRGRDGGQMWAVWAENIQHRDPIATLDTDWYCTSLTGRA